MKEPKDLGVKIGTKKEAFWTGVLNIAKQALEEAEGTAMLQKEVITMAGRKIKEEQRKGKSLNTAQ